MLLSRQAQRIMAARVQTRCTVLPHMRMRLHSQGKYWTWRLQQQVGRPLLARLGSAGALYSMFAACGKAGLCRCLVQHVCGLWQGWALQLCVCSVLAACDMAGLGRCYIQLPAA